MPNSENIMAAVNMAATSLYKILSTKNRVVLEQEYDNIVNNFNFKNINDPRLIKFLMELTNAIQEKKIRGEELQKFQEADVKRSARLATSVLDKLPEYWGSPWQWLTNIALRCLSSYLKHQEQEEDTYKILDERIRHIQQDDLRDCARLRSRLIEISWRLIEKYKLQSEDLLNEQKIKKFYDAVNIKNPEARLKSLKKIANDFRGYYPFWYFCVKAAQEISRDDLMLDYIENFEKVWRPVLVKDHYKLEISKYHALHLIKNGGPQKKIFALLDDIEKNNPSEKSESSLNNLFIGMTYFSLGEQKKGIEFIKMNIKPQSPNEKANAQYKIGDSYALQRNYAEAVKFYEQAANQGHIDACLKLAFIYQLGAEKIPKDTNKAAFYFRRLL